MESPSSTVRRRAWINSSRQWLTPEELDSEGLQCNPSASVVDDDVFSDGCFTGKIENWLLGCGSESCPENFSQLRSDSLLKHVDDELSLGADASVLNVGETTSEAGYPSSKLSYSRLISSTPRQALCLPSLNLGHSMTSSCLSSSTSYTTSSVSEVLQLYSEDAEETLYELGFGCDEPQVTVRIPPRFFTFPSLAQGINFRLFLDSQLRRIREEDPSLSLASRFRQVQVLTAMANAFYSLYSHVSRTPLQKLATPEFTFSSSPVERIERFRSSIRSEPRSPVERLKDTVSKMCLYTGSPRGSDSTSPQPSPKKKSSLPDVVDIVLEKVKTGVTKKLDLGEYNSNSTVVVSLTDGAKSCASGKEVQPQKTAPDSDTQRCNGNEICHKDVDTDENGVSAVGLDSVRTSLSSSLSGETVIETNHQLLLCQPELDSCSTQRDTGTAHLEPVSKFAIDLIHPQLAESVYQEPFCTSSPKTNTLCSICFETKHIDGPCPLSSIQTAFSEPEEDAHASVTRSFPDLASNGSFTQCCITVTGWEGEDVSSCSPNTQDSSQTSIVQPVKTCEDSFNKGKSLYLNPPTQQGQGPVSNNLQQVNSFELEEVHSAGEEDFGQLETTRTNLPLSKRCQSKEVVRDDSMHSDSSGYADEEVSHSRR